MKTTNALAMPAALVLSSLILAIGWNLSRSPSGPVAAAPVVHEAPAPVSPAPMPGPPVSLTPEIQARGVDNARLALEGWRARFHAQCWEPAVALVPEPSTFSLSFSLAFSPEGELLATGIIEDRRTLRSDVSACLRGIALDLKIPAPGLPLQVQVPFTLP